MEIIMGAVQRDRQLGKALRRIYSFNRALKAASRNRLKMVIDGIDTLDFIIQSDREDFVELIGTHKGDGFYQVAVGTPAGLHFTPDEDDLLIKKLAAQLARASEQLPFEESDKAEIARVILDCADKLTRPERGGLNR